MENNVLINFLRKMKGYGIFIEAGLVLPLINYFFFGDHKSIINKNLFFSSREVTATGILAILTILLLSLGFIYYIGYFIAARLKHLDMSIGGGGTLSQHILPFGAIFLIGIFISPLLIYLSSPEFSDIRKFIMINFGLVFFFGTFNESIIQYFDKKEKIEKDKLIKKIRESAH